MFNQQTSLELFLMKRSVLHLRSILLMISVVFWAVCCRDSWAQQAAPLNSPVPTSQGALPLQSRDGGDEDLTSLSLAIPLKSIPPLIADTAEYPDFTLQLLQVGWRQDDPIDLYVIKPKNVEKPPVIMYLYGYPSETDRFSNDEFCRLVTKNGFAAVGFVAAMDGHRYHDRPMRQWFVSELPEALVKSVHDVEMLLNYLSTRSDLDLKRIGMFGQGSGGTIAILAARADPRIKAINVLDPWGNWPEWMAKSTLIPEDERPEYTKRQFLDKVAALDPVRILPQLTLPIHLQDTLYEKETPKVSKDRIESVMPTSGSVTRYTTYEEFKDDLGEGKLLNWIKGQLQK
jgi:pimeloyl-ACP methyl ester carboxylesterase